MHFDGEVGPSGAPGFNDAAEWLGSASIVILRSQPGMVSYGLAEENGLPSYAEAAYLEAVNNDLRLLASVRNWGDPVSDGIEEEQFDRLIEHYMSACLTLHPGTPPSEYHEPELVNARRQDVLVDDVVLPALRVGDSMSLSGIITAVGGQIVTCVWDSVRSPEPSFTVRTSPASV